MASILDEIFAAKRAEVRAQRVAVKLDHVEAEFTPALLYIVTISVDEHADHHRTRADRAPNLPCVIDRKTARARRIEIEANHLSSESDRGLGIHNPRHPANFHQDLHDKSLRNMRRGSGEPCERLARGAAAQQAFTD